ncbi:MAG: peptidase M23, partial [Cellulomonas sp. 14-74-6]
AAAARAAAASGRPAQAAPGAWFVNPTPNDPIVVTSEYGMRLQPILKIWRLHAGIDLMDGCNRPVYAGRDGTVQWAEYRTGAGNQVMVDHGWVNGSSLMTIYDHLNSFAVSPGQRVSAGQLLGYAGMTGGVSTGCHLHFEVYINGATVNPRPYLGI